MMGKNKTHPLKLTGSLNKLALAAMSKPKKKKPKAK